MSEKILRTEDLRAKVPLSRTTIWQMEKDGKFPRRRQIGSGTVGWIESEVDQWIQSRPVVGTESA